MKDAWIILPFLLFLLAAAQHAFSRGLINIPRQWRAQILDPDNPESERWLQGLEPGPHPISQSPH